MKDRISDDQLKDWIVALKGRSMGRQAGDTSSFSGSEIRELIKVCEDLRDARDLLCKTSWLRKLEKPARKKRKG